MDSILFTVYHIDLLYVINYIHIILFTVYTIYLLDTYHTYCLLYTCYTISYTLFTVYYIQVLVLARAVRKAMREIQKLAKRKSIAGRSGTFLFLLYYPP